MGKFSSLEAFDLHPVQNALVSVRVTKPGYMEMFVFNLMNERNVSVPCDYERIDGEALPKRQLSSHHIREKSPRERETIKTSVGNYLDMVVLSDR